MGEDGYSAPRRFSAAPGVYQREALYIVKATPCISSTVYRCISSSRRFFNARLTAWWYTPLTRRWYTAFGWWYTIAFAMDKKILHGCAGFFGGREIIRPCIYAPSGTFYSNKMPILKKTFREDGFVFKTHIFIPASLVVKLYRKGGFALWKTT